MEGSSERKNTRKVKKPNEGDDESNWTGKDNKTPGGKDPTQVFPEEVILVYI